MAVYDTSPSRNFAPDLTNFYLLISCNIEISDPPPPLKYSDVFYGCPPMQIWQGYEAPILIKVHSSCHIELLMFVEKYVLFLKKSENQYEQD